MNQSPLDKARARAAELKALGIAIQRQNPLEKAQASPKSKALAIKAKCYDCVGRDYDPGWHRRVRECPVTDCALWPVRSA